MKSIGRSDFGGGRKTGGISIIMSLALTLFGLVTMATTVTSQTCTTVDKWQYDCLSSGQTSLSISCPAVYQVQFRKSVVYQMSASCPSTMNSSTLSNGACQQTSQTSSFPTCLTNVSTCSYSFTTPPSSGTCTGSYAVATQYRCMPVFNPPPASSTGTTVSQTSNVTIVSSGVVFASGTAPTSDTTRYFTIYLPANVEAIVSMKYFNKFPASNSCTSRVVVLDASNQMVAQFCNQSAPEFSISCSSSDRFFYVRYVSGSPTTTVLYAIQFTVPPSAQLSGQGGNAPVPLDSMITTEAPAPVSSATSAPPAPVTSGPQVSVTSGLPITSSSSISGSSVNNQNPITTSVVGTGNETSPASPTSGSGGSDNTVAIAVGVSVGGGVVALAVVIGVILYARTGATPAALAAVPKAAEASPQYGSVPPPSSAHYQLDPQSANTAPFRNVTEFYVDGNSTSKLILNRKNDPPVFKTVVRV